MKVTTCKNDFTGWKVGGGTTNWPDGDGKDGWEGF